MPISLEFTNLVIQKEALHSLKDSIWSKLRWHHNLVWEDDHLLRATGYMGPGWNDHYCEMFIGSLADLGLKGPSEGHWRDFCILDSNTSIPDASLRFNCDWLDMNFYMRNHGYAVRHIDDNSLLLHSSPFFSQFASLTSNQNGFIHLENYKGFTCCDNQALFLNDEGEIHVCDKSGRVLQKIYIPYGAKTKLKEGDPVKVGDMITGWDIELLSTFNRHNGFLDLSDLEIGKNLIRNTDDITGLHSYTVEQPDKATSPSVCIYSDSTKQHLIEEIHLPNHAIVNEELLLTSSDNPIASGTLIFRSMIELAMDQESRIKHMKKYNLDPSYKPIDLDTNQNE